MLEEAADDRAHPDVLRHAGNSRTQAADAADDEIDIDAGAGRLVERANDLGLHERVELRDDVARSAVRRVARLAPNEPEQALVQIERRLRQEVQIRRAHQARQLHEDLVDVFAERHVRRQQTVVRVRARRSRMVVAGAQVHVAAQPAVLAAHDERHLAVGLVADDAVDDVCARFLQLARELDVRRLVEAGAQLDQHRDFLAGLRRRDQALDERRVGRRAVQRLLDREHVGVGRSAVDEVDDGRERLERVMQQNVLLRDRLENVRLDERFRHAGRERRVLELGPIHEVVDREQPVQVDGARHLVEVRRA